MIFGKHWIVLKEAWKFERQNKKNKQDRHETDFLPAALEIIERPAHPLGRTFVWLLVSFFTISLLWAWFGKVDTVASAQGKIVLRENSKVIQASELGVVREIHVNDGDKVIKGDVLIELDPTQTSADLEQVKQNLTAANLKKLQAHSLVNCSFDRMIDKNKFIQSDISNTELAYELVVSRCAEFQATISNLKKLQDEQRAQLAGVDSELLKLKQILPLLEEQMAARKELMDKGLSPKLLYLQLQERHVAHTNDIDIQYNRQRELYSAIEAADSRIQQVRQEFRKTSIDEQATAEKEILYYRSDLKKALSRNDLQELKAPVDGTIQQLTTYTLGGVVQPAETLMVIVPGAGELIASALILNKDIGSVKVNDKVEVKLEAFPFTKYGVIEGILENISLDAIQDENLGLVYAARIRLDKSNITMGDKVIPISSGMTLTAEIKTGQRRVIEFILAPLLRYRDEALRER